jgi:hypothetical protein
VWNQKPDCNRPGYADIVLTVEECPTPGNCLDHLYVWEVKSLLQGAARASAEAEWYAEHWWAVQDGDSRYKNTKYWGGLKGAVVYGDDDENEKNPNPVKRHIDRLKEAGFRKAGRRYTAGRPPGNFALVQFRPYHAHPDWVGFYIEWSVIPTAVCAFYERNQGSKQPMIDWEYSALDWTFRPRSPLGSAGCPVPCGVFQSWMGSIRAAPR